MDTIRRGEMVYVASKNLSLTENQVRNVLLGYIEYIKDKLSKKESVNIFNIATLNVKGFEGYLDTLAYACTEVSKSIGVSAKVVKEILNYYEEEILFDIKQGYSHSITGLVTLSLRNGKLLVNKSRLLCNDVDFRLKTNRAFKRKAEGYTK